MKCVELKKTNSSKEKRRNRLTKGDTKESDKNSKNEFLESEGCNRKFRKKLSKLCDEKDICIIVLEPGYFDNGVKRFGKKKDGYAVVYDFDMLIEAISNEYIKNPPNKNYTIEDARSDAVEWIDFNTLRGIPYMSSGNSIAPIVVFTDEYGKEQIA